MAVTEPAANAAMIAQFGLIAFAYDGGHHGVRHRRDPSTPSRST
ncbi:hypothetical protein ACU686_25540 [Yinghuangia aomiensis]